jgi:LuxR family maltose regulon positive regulatory protein
MAAPILVTKLFIPPTRKELVHRPGLIKRLNNGLDRKLTLISAPAGFGKTTLVSEWVDTLALDAVAENQTEFRVSWLSLDEGDNDPVRFLTYVIAALNRVEGIEVDLGQGALSMLQSPQPPPTDSILTSLINEIASIPDRIILVLDDYHILGSSPVDDVLTFLLEHLPAQLHLVIATRENPHLPLSRLRARDQLSELRAVDLRFTSTEVAKFLNQVMGLDLSKEDIAALETRTEGWIAGLQLAAISMQRRGDTTNFIQSFTGSNRLVLDYLIEEVLNRQPKDVQFFLLHTAILNRLTGSLCDAITGQENGQEILGILEHTNLFIVPLDEERHWYRYHHLFSDLLRQRLKLTISAEITVLHLRASAWYEQNGFVDEAIEHALRAEDFEKAARMIEKTIETVWVRSEDTKFQRWLNRLPVELVYSKPQICIFHAWHLYLFGQIEEAKKMLDTAEQVLVQSDHRINETSPNGGNQTAGIEALKLRGRAAVVRSVLVSFQGDVNGLINYAKQALEYLPKDDLAWRSTALMSLGDAYDFLGEIASAYQVRLEALEVSKATGNVYMILFARLNLVFSLRDMGRLEQVQDICQQQIEVANQNGLSQTGVFGWLLATWGGVLAEKNELDRALQLSEKGVKLVEQSKDVIMLNWSYLRFIRILFYRGELGDAEEIIQKMQQGSLQHDVYQWGSNRMRAWQARIWLAKDKLEAASRCVNELELDSDGALSPLHTFDYLVLARVLLAQKHLEETSRLLQRLFDVAEAGEFILRMIENLILQALTFQAYGDQTQAMNRLEKALTLAEPGGFIRIFVDEGPPIASLLFEALHRGIKPEYVSRLLKAFPTEVPEQVAISLTQDSQSGLLEPLSERELDVLRLIAEGLTNSEIATRLVLSIHTIKTHTRNIYGKLDAHNRMEAVAKARALGVLPFSCS